MCIPHNSLAEHYLTKTKNKQTKNPDMIDPNDVFGLGTHSQMRDYHKKQKVSSSDGYFCLVCWKLLLFKLITGWNSNDIPMQRLFKDWQKSFFFGGGVGWRKSRERQRGVRVFHFNHQLGGGDGGFFLTPDGLTWSMLCYQHRVEK